MAKKILCVAAARPNFMKLAPLVRALSKDPAFLPLLVHTGQHYDDAMSGQFFRELGLPDPVYNLESGPGSHAVQTAEVLRRFEPVVLREHPDIVVVVGDVNSTLACALTAAKLNVPVAHVEAGLRSFDRTMPEEINRILTDSISTVLLLTEESAIVNLRNEGIDADRMHFVGNLMIDSLRFHLESAAQSDVLTRLGLERGRFGLVTLHRPANVDSPEQFAEILSALNHISEKLPLCFPVHPRTRGRLQAYPQARSIRFTDPLGYLDFVCLMANSVAVFTDSGGIQEETTALGIPCLTLRDNTERPITITEGTNRLAGTCRSSILTAWEETCAHPPVGRIPKLWDGRAAERCVAVLHSTLGHPEPLVASVG
jgi:UDP-N-acetylglucosamine 2-epimerase (non-hydrolysing)